MPVSSLAHPHTSGHDSVARSAKTGAREEYGVTFLASMQTALLLQEWRTTTGSGQMKGGKETGSKRRPVCPGASMCTAMALATTRHVQKCVAQRLTHLADVMQDGCFARAMPRPPCITRTSTSFDPLMYSGLPCRRRQRHCRSRGSARLGKALMRRLS